MADWNTACLDWERRLLEGRSLVPELPLFEDQRARGLRIFKRLRVPDMRGLPMMGDVAGPWLFPIVEAIFGSYDPILQRRMIQEFFLLMPKKNGKTSTGASIMVDALIINNRPEGEFVLIAPTKEIAGIAFKQARGTIKVDPELDKLFQVQDHLKTITHRRMGSTLQVKAADTDVITGGKQVGTLIDELHVLASKSNAADILVELRGALAARPDGFLIIITTQSKAPPRGVFKSELQKARDVRDGKLQLPLLPVLYELPLHLAKDDGWKKRTFWPLVNPNLGRSVDEAFLERELVSAVSEARRSWPCSPASISTSRSASRSAPTPGPALNSGNKTRRPASRSQRSSSARTSSPWASTAAAWTICSGSASSAVIRRRVNGCHGATPSRTIRCSSAARARPRISAISRRMAISRSSSACRRRSSRSPTSRRKSTRPGCSRASGSILTASPKSSRR
ncbi:protein of unknown function [Methylocella tundrae]|uniref:Terminase large subunit-like ATPase domain-containing protein n=1 Tax=Methylocella tundrae TaxID=227605 RepID=A0A4U8YUP1_METTU|nr:protein of unknown function [Methylocella tundrae]